MPAKLVQAVKIVQGIVKVVLAVPFGLELLCTSLLKIQLSEQEVILILSNIILPELEAI